MRVINRGENSDRDIDIYAEISHILDTIDTIVTKLLVATIYNQLNVTMLCMTLNTVSTLQTNH